MQVSGRTQAILAELERRFPCGAIPFGLQVEMAARYGLTRQRINQIVQKAGYQKLVAAKAASTCLDCDQPRVRGGRYCVEHKMVPLSCGQCQQVFSIPRHIFNARLKQGNRGRKETQFYCSKQCFGRNWAATHGFLAHPENARRVQQKTRSETLAMLALARERYPRLLLPYGATQVLARECGLPAATARAALVRAGFVTVGKKEAGETNEVQ